MTNYTINFTDPDKSSFLIKPFTTDGPVFPTFIAGPTTSIGQQTSLLIYGKSMPEYGERIQENIIHLLENFAGPSEPANPIEGQLWYRVRSYFHDTGGDIWYIWDDTGSPGMWTVITIDPGAPVGVPSGGDGTYRIGSGLLYRYTIVSSTVGDSAQWLLVEFTAAAADPNSPLVEPERDLLLRKGGSWFTTTGSYVLKSGDTMTGDLIMSSGTAVKLFPAGSPLFDPEDAVNRAYIDALDTGDIANVSGVSGTTASDALDTLNTGLSQKLNLTGGTLTGFLTLNADPTAFLHAATKQYVDSAVLGVADGVVSGGFLGGIGSPPDPNALVLTRTLGLPPVEIPGFALQIHNHPASVITFTPSGSVASINVQDAISEVDSEKAPILNPFFSGLVNTTDTVQVSRDPLTDLEVATKQYVDSARPLVRRKIFTATGSPIEGPYTTPKYEVGANTLFVSVNGQKYYLSGRGFQDVLLSGFSTRTGLAPSIVDVDQSAPSFIVQGNHTSKFIEGLTFSVANSTGNDGSYTVAAPGSSLTEQIVNVQPIADVGGNLDGTYFLISSTTTEYYVWMNVSGSPVSDPGPIGVGSPTRTGVAVNINPNDDAGTIAAAIAAALDALSDFSAVSVASPALVTITNSTAGEVLSEAEDFNTTFIVSVAQEGGDTEIPVTTSIPSAVNDGVAAPVYAFTLSVDGSSPLSITINGEDARTYAELVFIINGEITNAGLGSPPFPGAQVLLNFADDLIHFESDSYGGTSSILLTETPLGSPPGSPVGPLPLFSSLADFVAIDTPVSGSTLGYQEIGAIGDDSTSFVFESPGPPNGATVEVLIF